MFHKDPIRLTESPNSLSFLKNVNRLAPTRPLLLAEQT